MSANEIRNQIASYLAGEIDADQFEDWIAQNTWNIHQIKDSDAEKLAYSIEAKLAEFSGGDIDEAVLRGALLPFVTSFTPELSVEWASIDRTPNMTAATNVTAQFPFALLAPHCA